MQTFLGSVAGRSVSFSVTLNQISSYYTVPDCDPPRYSFVVPGFELSGVDCSLAPAAAGLGIADFWLNDDRLQDHNFVEVWNYTTGTGINPGFSNWPPPKPGGDWGQYRFLVASVSAGETTLRCIQDVIGFVPEGMDGAPFGTGDCTAAGTFDFGPVSMWWDYDSEGVPEYWFEGARHVTVTFRGLSVSTFESVGPTGCLPGWGAGFGMQVPGPLPGSYVGAQLASLQMNDPLMPIPLVPIDQWQRDSVFNPPDLNRATNPNPGAPYDEAYVAGGGGQSGGGQDYPGPPGAGSGGRITMYGGPGLGQFGRNVGDFLIWGGGGPGLEASENGPVPPPPCRCKACTAHGCPPIRQNQGGC